MTFYALSVVDHAFVAHNAKKADSHVLAQKVPSSTLHWT